MIKAKRDELLAPLAAVSGIIERRHTLPILSNVLVDGASESVSFLATDIEIQIAAKSGIGGGRDAKAFTVGARKVLRRQLGLVHYAMAQQDIRYYLNGLLMVVDGGELRLVATDGHRLAFASLPLETSMPRQEAIVPRKTVLELTKLLADSDDEVRIELSATQAAFSFGAIELVSKLVDGKFPDYTRVIPTQHKNRMQAQREPLRQALQRAAILSNEKFRGVRWVLGDASLKIVSSNAEQEEAQEELEVGYNGDALDIGFNVNYLLDVLNNVPGAELECAFGDASSSALISYASEQGFKYVVMPMRI